MQKISSLLLKLFILFLLVQVLGKVIFIAYHADHFHSLSLADKIGIFRAGFVMDIAIAAYQLMLPVLLAAIFTLFKNKVNILQIILRYYTITICLLNTFIIVFDVELYRTWHFRIDNTPLKYLSHPAEMWASTAASPFHILVPIWLLLVLCIGFIIHLLFKPAYRYSTIFMPLHFFFYVIGAAALIIPIRGGLQLAPLNQSSVYFSNNYFANQAAINPVFNFIHALVKRENGANPFNYMPTLQAKDLVKEIFREKEGHYSVLNHQKPNVLLITWESLTAKALNKAYCNGFEVLPTFKKISQEGLYFPNTYASGDRSDKGLIAILSGYPAQPIASIMTIPQKTAKLPVISADLKKNGYFTAWYYGGEPEFANIKTYISHGQFDKVVTKADYPSELTDTKWGANDKTTFSRLFTDLRTMKQPFFVNTFTLSSHEPFEIPNHDVIKGKDEKSKFLNALNYTDTQLGWFLAEIKKEPWYANTLVIIIADHGHRLPETIDKLEEFQIPMLWLGGALAQKAQVRPESVSQNDLAKSLLNQLNVPSGDYIWSKDLFSSTYKSSAYFAYRNGFGFINSQNHVIFDNDTKKIRQSKAQNTQILLKQGQAMVQETYADFLSK